MTTGLYRDQGNGGGKFDRTGDNLLTISEDQKLRATEVLDQIVFTYKPGRSMTKEKNIVLTIPGGWTQPVQDNNDGMNEPGEVTINQGSVSISSGGGGWRISTGIYDPAPTMPVIINYRRVTVPKRAGDYQFGFTSNVVGEGHVSQLDSHLLMHARGVAADEGGHTHGDIGSRGTVEEHTHDAAGITGESFTIAVHTHTGDDITPISVHTHRRTEITTDATETTEVHRAKNHAHDGANGDVVKVYGHTHNGNGEDEPEGGWVRPRSRRQW